MRFSISESDALCRYLRCGLHDNYFGFNRLLKELGIIGQIDDGEMRRWLERGLIIPSMVVEVPDEYYESWRNYPECPATYEGPENLLWADYADTYPFPSADEKYWFLHPYDQPNVDEEIETYIEHQITFKTPIPSDKRTARGSNYNNWVIHIPYWQAYRLYDALRNSVVVPAIRSFEHPVEYCRRFLQNSSELITYHESWLDSILKRWDNYANCFEAVSFFRGVVGLALKLETRGAGFWNELIVKGGRELSDYLSIKPSSLEYYLQNVLLRLYYDWDGQKMPSAPAPMLLHLQQDIYFLLLWLQILTGKSEEEYYATYANSTRFDRGYSDLHEALPDEEMVAKSDLPQLLLMYLRDAALLRFFDNCTPQTLSALFVKMEAKAPVTGVWVRNFYRLHKGINTVDILSFSDESTADFISLMALKTETLLVDLWDINNEKKTLKPIIKEAIEKSWGKDHVFFRGFQAIEKQWDLVAKAHSTAAEVEATSAGLEIDEDGRWFARQILHFARARNFLVHKSSFRESDLDDQLRILFTAMVQILLLFALAWESTTSGISKNGTSSKDLREQPIKSASVE